jgi:hypothetical protein
MVLIRSAAVTFEYQVESKLRTAPFFLHPKESSDAPMVFTPGPAGAARHLRSPELHLPPIVDKKSGEVYPRRAERAPNVPPARWSLPGPPQAPPYTPLPLGPVPAQ